MSRSGKAFELGGIVVPIHAALDLQQRIEPISGSTLLRLGQGAGIKQTAWSGKRRVTLSASGWCPPGLSGLDYAAPLLLRCGLPDAVSSTSATITLPATRRTDAGYLPFARAHLPGGWQDTAVSMAGHVATCTAVTGAVGYTVWYYPELSVYADPPAVEFDGAGAAVAWELVAEEV